MMIDTLLAIVRAEAIDLGIPVATAISPKVLINKRARSRFGCCRKTPIKESSAQQYVIELSERVLECNEKTIKGILAHEVLHTCEGCYNHSSLWKEYAQRMNTAFGYQIKRMTSYEALGLEKNMDSPQAIAVHYRLQCTSCGTIFNRQRKSALVRNPKRYRCKCGGTIIRL